MTLLINYLNRTLILLLALLVGCTMQSVRPQTIEDKFLVAVLPVENLSGKYAPLKEIRESIIKKLKESNFSVLDDETLERFMARYRIRYVGGLDSEVAAAFKKEINVDGVLITSLELYTDFPPKISVNCRMLKTDEEPSILWMESIGLTGYDSPGLLGLGMINNKEVLMDKAFSQLFESLVKKISGDETYKSDTRSRYNPKVYYSAPNGYCPEKKCTVAVVPFFNSSDRKNAGEIISLHFVKELLKEGFNVIEPGDVRQKLLTMRVTMNDGLSMSDAYFLSNALGADLIFTGRVLEYRDVEDATRPPMVDFSTQVFYAKEKRVIWSSKSFNKGDDGVIMFDIGRVNTANRLATYMTKNVIEKLLKESENSLERSIVEKNGKKRLWGFYSNQ